MCGLVPGRNKSDISRSRELVSKSCLKHSSVCWECRSAFAFQQVFPNLSNGSNDSLPPNIYEMPIYTRNRTVLNTIVPVILIIYKLNLWGLSYWQTGLSRRYEMKNIVNQSSIMVYNLKKEENTDCWSLLQPILYRNGEKPSSFVWRNCLLLDENLTNSILQQCGAGRSL